MPRRLALLLLLSATLAGCGDDPGGAADAGTPEGQRSVTKPIDGHVAAYLKVDDGDDGHILLDPPTAADGELHTQFAGFLYTAVSRDGTRIASSKADSDNFLIVSDWEGNVLSEPLYGVQFEWNPSGTFGAYNTGYGGFPAIVDRDGTPFPIFAVAGPDGEEVLREDLEFQGWVNDDVMFVTENSYAAIAEISEDDNSLTLTPIDVDNANYPTFDRQGGGMFVDEGARLRKLDPDTGEISELASISPAPNPDYILDAIAWSSTADEFSAYTDEGVHLCRWEDDLACEPVALPDGFEPHGTEFAPDGSLAAYSGKIDEVWSSYFVDLTTMDVTEVAYPCPGTNCGIQGFVTVPD